MKKLLCVWGAADYGKSYSIIEFDSLLNKNFDSNIQTIHSFGNLPYDIQRIYKIGNFTIGIESQGDPNSRQKASLTLVGKNNCDIIICASRTKGDTVANVDNFCHRHGYDCFWLSTIYSPKTYKQSGTILNQRNGQVLFDIVSDFMNGKY